MRYTPLWEQAGSYAAGVDRRLISSLWPNAATSGMTVTATSGMVLAVAPGFAAVPSSNNTGSLLCVSDAIENVTLTAEPAAGNSRIDIVYVLPRANDIDGGPNNDFIFAAVAGAASTGTPAPPTVPAGALALANVAVGGGVAAIVAANITDTRPGGIPPFPAAAPRGFLARTLGPAVQTDCPATFTTVITTTVQAVAGRWYRASCDFNAQQITAIGNAQASLANSQNAETIYWILYSANVGNAVRQSGTYVVQATTTGTLTFTLSGVTSAGALRFAVNSARVSVEDCGTGAPF